MNGTRHEGSYRVGGNKAVKTQGGYSETYIIHEDFAVVIPNDMNMAEAAPILCGGATMYDPLKHFGALDGKKMTIGIVGIGGLGTFGIKFAKALGHTVVAISTSANKEEMAKKKGADKFVVSTDPESIKAHAGSCNIILNTVSANHDLNVYLPLIHRNGTLVQLGLCSEPHPIRQMSLMNGRKRITGTFVANTLDHQECVDFCKKNGILSDVQIIEANQLDWVYEQLEHNKDGIRYVLDVKKSLENPDFCAKI